jgi:hypothetical protein
MKQFLLDALQKDLLAGVVRARQDGEVLTIERYPPKGLLATAGKTLLIAWLGGWGLAEFDIARLLVFNLPYKGGAHARSDSSVWASLAIWSIGGIAALLFLYKLLFSGPERIVVTASEVSWFVRVGRFSRNFHWQLDRIKEMHVTKVVGRGAYTIQFTHISAKMSLTLPADRTSTNQVFELLRSFLVSQGRSGMFTSS